MQHPHVLQMHRISSATTAMLHAYSLTIKNEEAMLKRVTAGRHKEKLVGTTPVSSVLNTATRS